MPRLMARVLAKEELPQWASTRDGRDRLDLVTDEVGLGARLVRADRVVYHPGDSAARHYHAGCDHVFHVLEGSGLMYVGDERHRLRAGMTAVVRALEVHWFENDTDADFAFVEFWAPPPDETVWLTDDT